MTYPNPVLEAITHRRSIRKYKDVALEWDKVGEILEAGRYAPSAGNTQHWKFIVVMDKKRRADIAEACVSQMWMQDAPVHIVVVSHVERVEQMYGAKGKDLYAIQDSAAAIENMLICASALQVGSCWVSAFDEEKLDEILEIPSGNKVQAVLTLGYADEITPRPPKYSLEIVTFLETFGNRIGDMSKLMGFYSDIAERTIKKAAGEFQKTAKGVRSIIKEKLMQFRDKKKTP